MLSELRDVAIALVAACMTVSVTTPGAPEPRRVFPRARPAVTKKAPVDVAAEEPSPLLATLVDTHSPVRLSLDDAEPAASRFDALLHDPVLGGVHAIDPAILSLVRTLARHHPLARIELVSGFRSPRLNEALRKKGHHVASHSQHSLGRAMDLRIVGEEQPPLGPRALAAEIRSLGWKGGVGIYLGTNDLFVHADTGPLRTWYGQ